MNRSGAAERKHARLCALPERLGTPSLSYERSAMPGDTRVIEAGQAFACKPSIVGCKSEDTILIGRNGFEIVTQASPGRRMSARSSCTPGSAWREGTCPYSPPSASPPPSS
ncbi:MAG: hypothetical protein ABI700_24155, partial [Chloroflexota bacterium]